MRRDVLELRQFYASSLGRAAREMLTRKVVEAWGEARGLDVLGLGYATPVLEALKPLARRTIAAMPAEQGVEAWPSGGRNLACLAGDTGLPFANAMFDRVLIVHGLEEADDPLALLRETWRVMAPSGRVILAAASRRGLWANSETTPFGVGRPFSRSQLEQLVREAELEPIAWSRALYVPPAAGLIRFAEGFERVGSRLWPAFSGLILLEAVKQTFALKPTAARLPAQARAPVGLRPAPAARDGTSWRGG
jgi:SAM-dependent methyltransferase